MTTPSPTRSHNEDGVPIVDIKPLLTKLWPMGKEVSPDEIAEAISHFFTNSVTEAQTASLLVALHFTSLDMCADVLARCARVMLQAMSPVPVEQLRDVLRRRARSEGSYRGGLCDVVGTGGDSHNTFNISTTSSILASALLLVSKHGNKASTSKSGSADMIGCIKPQAPVMSAVRPDTLPKVYSATNYGFLFAPLFHTGMRFVAPVRRQLPWRTIFNNVGPLANPLDDLLEARVIGIGRRDLGPPFSEALRSAGCRKALIVCGEEELDEISCAGPTLCWALRETSPGGEVVAEHFKIQPSDFGLVPHPLSQVSPGKGPEENAEILRRILHGELADDDPLLDFVLINTAALFVVSGICEADASAMGPGDDGKVITERGPAGQRWKEGVRRARWAMKSGEARKQWEAFIDVTNEIGSHECRQGPGSWIAIYRSPHLGRSEVGHVSPSAMLAPADGGPASSQLSSSIDERRVIAIGKLPGTGLDACAGWCKSRSRRCQRRWAEGRTYICTCLQPYCTQILGDLGADVIKVEHPIRGDDTRAWGPPYAHYKRDCGAEGPGESAYFLGANRNKKSLALSFQHKQGVDILHKLVAKCDVVVENYLPGTLAKYSLDYETLRAINPGLVYTSITGYGQTGPYSSRAGYDVMVEAEFGLMHITGSRDGPPVKVGVAVVDLTTGLYACNSIMAALLGRARTGKGQHIDVALSDCQTATLANIASSCLVSGQPDSGRWGTAHPSIVPYRSFKTKDGDVLFGCGNDRLFGILCDRLGHPEWKDDARYKTNADRVANRAELEAGIETQSKQKTTQEWLDKFEGSGMPYAAVNDVLTTLNHEHTRARNMVIEMDHGACGPLKMVNTPIKLSESQPTVRTAPPMLGQHTEELLKEHLGLSQEEIGRLKQEGVVRYDEHNVEGQSEAQPYIFTMETSMMDGQRVSPASKAAYEPQFTQLDCLILSRLRQKTDKTGAEPRREADTLSMPLEQQGSSSSTTTPAKSSLKRRRESGPAESRRDATQSTTPQPAPVASKPVPEEGVAHGRCRACLGTLARACVTCHVCRGSWHRLCAPKPGGSSASYLCAECRLAVGEVDGDTSLGDRRLLVDMIRARRLDGRVPAKPHLVGFLAGQASDSEVSSGARRICRVEYRRPSIRADSKSYKRIEYFRGKKRTDLLNVLSLCDQLKPRLLIDVLVSVSKKHPDLPMFDDPAWRRNLHRSKPPSPHRPRPALPLPSGKAFKKPRGRPRNAPTKQMIPSETPPQTETTRIDKGGGGGGGEGEAFQANNDAAESSPARAPLISDVSIAVADCTLPPTWPRAGQGLYAKLPPEDEDRRFLVDDNDEEAFSHFLVDKLGRQAVLSTPVLALIQTEAKSPLLDN
ncbi:hypothetical protein L249_3551 [Ophiocordyceps polyrhachis-furcata BCC 54312]|uniref:PHD-type domain-containing protein n=1 Tax=Ophiocordyceps polyrhachis-furcata BCC 54312 TaxID=1330021 RepID=A0A367LMB7_9HYPO|nr:hypothetical protein L249_3551 [Ophiocordyceps polyrhachis-furcata BCC 54312]